MKKKIIRTLIPMQHTAIRFKKPDKDLWLAAASKVGETRAEFIRIAMRERARRVMLADLPEDQRVA